MEPLHFLLGHVVADHAFTNNAKIRRYSGVKLFGHIVWSIFAILAFTFDVVFASIKGLITFAILSAVHAVLDLLRVKYYKLNRKIVDLVELVGVVTALTVNVMSFEMLENSYLSREFVFYLLGMSVVSVGITYLFRNFYPGDENIHDVDGISERLAVFIFLIASKPLLVFMSISIAIVYRLIFVRKVDHTWWVSPVSGILISYLWKVLLFR